MKEKTMTLVSFIMMFVPWTILPLRSFSWALESPAAEIMISAYALFMIFSGVFSIMCYGKKKIQNTIMKICVVVNGMYAVFGEAAFGMMILPNIVS